MVRKLKWILMPDDTIYTGFVFYHMDLIPKHDHQTPLGGGLIKIDKENKKLIFHGKSDQYGPVHTGDFMRSISHESVKDNLKSDLVMISWMTKDLSKFETYDDFDIVFEEYKYY